MAMQGGTDAAKGSSRHSGGCLCGKMRYATEGQPLRVTICHCTFCQRLTGSAYLVEPIFRRDDVDLAAMPKEFELKSTGSGKTVRVNFCGDCGTTLFLSFERFPEYIGVCAGTFDDPNWFDRGPGTCRHIFTQNAQAGVVLPAHVEIYPGHAIGLDGSPNSPTVLAAPQQAR